jgi:dTMP kinase
VTDQRARPDKPAPGRFITLEGLEGVGKSTHAALIAEFLRRRGLPLVLTREPGGVPVAEQIRSLLLATDGTAVPPVAELLLMLAARAAHVELLIRPALAQGDWVVCDRFADATYAYQGAGRGISLAQIEAGSQLAHAGLWPDLTILLDAPWKAVAPRVQSRAGDRFEQEGPEFFERVREGYLARAAHEPGRIRVVDAMRPLDKVQAEIARLLGAFVSENT